MIAGAQPRSPNKSQKEKSMNPNEDSAAMSRGKFSVLMMESVGTAGHVVAGCFLGYDSNIIYPHDDRVDVVSVCVRHEDIPANDAEMVRDLVIKGDQQKAVKLCNRLGMLHMSGEAARNRFGPPDKYWAKGEMEMWEMDICDAEIDDPDTNLAIEAEIWNVKHSVFASPIGRCLRLNRIVWAKLGRTVGLARKRGNFSSSSVRWQTRSSRTNEFGGGLSRSPSSSWLEFVPGKTFWRYSTEETDSSPI